MVTVTDLSGNGVINGVTVDNIEQIGDGVNVLTIKPPSTAATSTDTPLVVAVSPNNSVTVIPNPSTNSGGHGIAFTGLSVGATTVTQIKSSNANIGAFSLTNTSIGVRWVKVFLLPSASVTMGVTNCSMNFRLAAGQTREVQFPLGFRSSSAPNTGLSYAVTSGAALNDNTATGLAAGDVEINVVYN